MNGLYLEEGETFVMTTHRISVDFIQYDMMLTSKNLILLDSSHTTINPQKIPLSTVLAVNAGTTAAREPVITLTFIRNEGEEMPLPMNLLFSQNTGEQRKAERDDWVKLLMEQVVALQQSNLLSRPVRDVEDTGISARPFAPMRGIDMPLPHKSLIREEPVLVDLRVVPEEGFQIQKERGSEIVARSGLPEDEEEREARGEEGTFSSRGTNYPGSAAIPENQIAADEMRAEGGDRTGTGLIEEGATTGAGKEGASTAERLTEPEPVPEVTGSPSELSEPSLQPMEQVPSEPEPVSAPEPVTPILIPGATPESEKKTEQKAGPEPVPDVITTHEPPSPYPISEGPAAGNMPEQTQQTSPKTSPVSWPAIPPEISREILEEITRESTSGDSECSLKEKTPARLPVEKPGPGKNPSFPSLKTVAASAIIIVIILAITGGVIYASRFIPDSTAIPQPPVDNSKPNVTISPSVPVSTPFVIPQDGIWLLMNGSYDGYYGRPGNLIHVADSGHRLYRIGGRPPLFQIIFRNQDNSGKLLMVEVYNDGTRVLSRSTTVPGGTIEFIVDPTTGEFPRPTPTPTSWTGLSPGVTYRT